MVVCFFTCKRVQKSNFLNGFVHDCSNICKIDSMI